MTKITWQIILGLFLMAACTSSMQNHAKKEALVGALTWEQIEKDFQQELASVANAPLNAEAIKKLRELPSGKTVAVYFGSWCSDSIRELSRLRLILDALGEKPPFKIHYIGVDRQKHAPELPADLDLSYVPTFVVSKDGLELGRIIESAPSLLEVDLLSLLAGTKSGVISGRADLN